jgi:hypothetical protein
MLAVMVSIMPVALVISASVVPMSGSWSPRLIMEVEELA